MTTFHLLPKEGGWVLLQEGNPEPVQNYANETKEEAVDLAVEYVFAQTDDGSLRIHREDGTFEEERTYPRPADPVTTDA